MTSDFIKSKLTKDSPPPAKFYHLKYKTEILKAVSSGFYMKSIYEVIRDDPEIQYPYSYEIFRRFVTKNIK